MMSLNLLRKYSSNIRTIQDACDYVSNAAGKPLKWNAKQYRNVKELDPCEEDRARLMPQPVSQSKCKFLIPVQSDLLTREKYVSYQGKVRIGKLLEDLDVGAVLAGYKHNKRDTVEGSFALTLVTAAVDEIKIHNPSCKPDDGDLELRSHVSWVGNSSIEVTESILQNNSVVLDAKFLMVARHTTENRAVPVNSLILESEEDKKAFEAGEKSKESRKINAHSSLLNLPPSYEESKLIHSIFTNSLDLSQRTFKRAHKAPKDKWMSDAIHKSSMICNPEHRNIHNKIFGGHIMRQAFELSWSNALMYAGNENFAPVFVDDISFRKPVCIGDLLLLSAQVLYAAENYIIMRCHAEVHQIQKGTQETTNEFYFIFSLFDDNGKPVEAPKVVPRSYAEYMLYLDGKRRFDRNHPNITVPNVSGLSNK